MTQAEFENLIREEMVLRGEQEGLEGVFLDKVQPLGLDIEDVRRMMEKVRVQLDNNRDTLDELQQRIRLLGQRRANRLSNDDLNLLAADAARLYLTPDFVRNRWVPSLLNQRPEVPVIPSPMTPDAVLASPVVPPIQPEKPAATILSEEAVRRKIHEILDEYDGHIPAQSLRFLFKAIDYDEQALAKKILAYLSEHFYASVKPPKGITLKEKLVSTDWRHLSYWEKESKPAAPAPEQPSLLLFEANPADVRSGEPVTLTWRAANTPTVTLIGVGQNLPPEGSRTVVPAKTTTYTIKGPSGEVMGVVTVEVSRPSIFDRAGLWGILLALLMLALTVWVIQYDPPETEDTPRPRKRKPRIEQSATENAPVSVPEDTPAAEEQPTEEPTNPSSPKSDTLERPTEEAPSRSSAENPNYDQILEGSGDFGELRARKDGLWGLWLPDAKRWLIKPKYDEISVFQEGRAHVLQDGNMFDIDPTDERIENE